MSGGHFEYKHHYIQDIIDSIQKEIDCNNTPNELLMTMRQGL